MQPLTSQDLPTMATAERNHQTIFWRPPSAAKLFFHQPTPQRPRSLTALTDSHQFAAANDAGGDDLHTSRSYLSREDVGWRRPEHRGFPNILIYIKSNRLTLDRWAERRWKQGNWEVARRWKRSLAWEPRCLIPLNSCEHSRKSLQQGTESNWDQ